MKRLIIFVFIIAIISNSTNVYQLAYSSKLIIEESNIMLKESSLIDGISFKDVINAEKPLVVKFTEFNILESGVKPAWKDFVIENNADILLLIETGKWVNTDNEDFQSNLKYINDGLLAEGKQAYSYYNVTYDGGISTGGQAVLSRYKILNFTQVNEYALDDGSLYEISHPLLHAVVEINGVGVNIVTVHMSCCDGGQSAREQEMEASINYIDDHQGAPFVFAGDFNSLASADKEFFPDGSGNLGVEPIDMLLGNTEAKSPKNHKFLDVYKELNPSDPGFTYEDAEFQSRIDYFFTNEFFNDKLINSSVISSTYVKEGSDHYALETYFNFNPEIADLRPPFKVTGMDATVSETEITITWNKNSATDVDYYSIYRDSIFLGNVDNTTLSFLDDTVTANTIYRYQVHAIDNSSNVGKLSNKLIINSTRGILTVPGSVSVSGNVDDKKITLSWTVDNDGGLPIKYYIIYRTTQSGYDDGRSLIYANITESTFTDTSVRNERSYYYKIIAFNELGRGEDSDFSKFTPTDGESNSDSEKTPIQNQYIVSAFIVIAIYSIFLRKRNNK